MSSTAIRWLAVAFAVFHVYNNWLTAVSELWFAAIHFGGFGALCALTYRRDAEDVPRHRLTEALNVLLAVASIAVAVYLVLFEDALYVREAEFITSDYIFSAIAVLLAMEFTRRTTGGSCPS